MSEVVELYDAGDEDARMVHVRNRVEWERTLELLERWLPPVPARWLGVGGASGLLRLRLAPVRGHPGHGLLEGHRLDLVLGDAGDVNELVDEAGG